MVASSSPSSATPAALPVHRLDRTDGETIAYCTREGQPDDPGLVWLGGFHSDMDGTKALAVDAWAAARGRACTRFDYFGHGQSSGAFADGTIGRWKDDALAVLDQVTQGPQILVGSSMGGWIATLVALARPERIAGIVYIAPAPDFTEDLMWARFPEEVRAELQATGQWLRPSDYDPEPYPITFRLIEEGRDHLVLREPIPITCPVRVFQGMADPDVPWQHAVRLIETLASEDIITTFVKNGDHRLSDEANIARLSGILDSLA